MWWNLKFPATSNIHGPSTPEKDDNHKENTVRKIDKKATD